MATVQAPQIDYPNSDGKPIGETPRHRRNITDLIQSLEAWYEADANTYVSGNMFLYYVRADKKRHVSPDVFVVHGIPKFPVPERRRYLTWEEGKSPDLVIEITSESTTQPLNRGCSLPTKNDWHTMKNVKHD